MEITPLIVGNVNYILHDKTKTVIVLFRDGEATEFSSVQAAKDFLENAALTNANFRFAQIYELTGDQWVLIS